MLAVLFLVLLTSLTWGTDWYRYQGTISWNWRTVTGQTERYSQDLEVLLCYDTTPWSISVEHPVGNVWWSGEFDKEGTKLQFRASSLSGVETVVGRGAFNARETTLNLQGSAFFRSLPNRSQFGQYRFRGAFVDIISR
jgi:hypothetical protein